MNDGTKRALVTGASEGIGRAFAEALATEGYAVTLAARSRDRLVSLSGRLVGTGHEVLVADLSTPRGIAQVAACIAERRFHLLVNNAGVGVYGPFQAARLEALQAMTRLNCDAVMALSQSFLQRAESGDALINVASTVAFLGMPQAASAYAATKAFVISLSEGLWYEQKERGVYVMALCPGVTDTRFHENAGGIAEQRPPQNLSQPPGEVVAEALRALAARSQPVVVSGVKNGVMAFTTRLLSAKARLNLMGRMTRPPAPPKTPAE